ncbi:MAG: PIG-L family deacetylase [Nitrososphaeraceae archaeon]|jgi:LmbE family N-acetylglucosaminyl deacetylase
MNRKESILIFGAHPDDIEIGMGGTVAKLSQNDNYNVHLVIATLPNFVKFDTKEGRQSEATNSAKLMGCGNPELLDLSPDEVVFNRKFVGIIDKIVREHQPDAVFTQWIGDSHQDHQALTRAVIAACRDLNNLFMYETTIPGGITESAFRPQLYVDIANTIEIKKNALNCFDSQKIRCGQYWIDAIIGRCRYRGYQMNTEYAEAFEVVRVSKW